jgi:hypothetical protein
VELLEVIDQRQQSNGRAEAGLASAGPDDPDGVARELVAAGGFDEQKAEIAEVAEDVLRKLADTLYEAVVEADAADVLAQWEGFGRFCRERLSVEPLTLVRAYGLQREDPAAELVAAHSATSPDEAQATQWAEQWTRSWGRRFAKRG